MIETARATPASPGCDSPGVKSPATPIAFKRRGPCTRAMQHPWDIPAAISRCNFDRWGLDYFSINGRGQSANKSAHSKARCARETLPPIFTELDARRCGRLGSARYSAVIRQKIRVPLAAGTVVVAVRMVWMSRSVLPAVVLTPWRARMFAPLRKNGIFDETS